VCCIAHQGFDQGCSDEYGGRERRLSVIKPFKPDAVKEALAVSGFAANALVRHQMSPVRQF
jgi:hypothetical protein